VRLRLKFRPKRDEYGGLVPTDMDRAQQVDLVTLPTQDLGATCGNCRWMEDTGMCGHPRVQMPVNQRMHCKLWESFQSLRHFITG
jgi:hypothetical protein